METSKELDLVTFLNPLSVEKSELKIAICGNLVDTIDACGLRFPAGINCIILLNGEIVPREEWELTYPKINDRILLKLIPQGGGGNKNILRIVMTIALVAATWGWGGIIAGGFQGIGATVFGAGTWGAFGLNVGLTYAGMLLIDKIAPLPTLSTSRAREEAPKSFGIESSRNRLNPWGAVPVLLGKHRFHPPYAAQPYSEIVGDDQYVNMLFCIGYHPVYIEDMKLGTVDLDDYIEASITAEDYESSETNRNIEVYVHENFDPGNNSTDKLRYFKNDIYEDGNSTQLTYAAGYIKRTTAIDTDEIIVDVTAPNGVYGITNSGGKNEQTVEFEIQYAPTGTGNNSTDWSTGISGKVISANNFAIPLPGNATKIIYNKDEGTTRTSSVGYTYTRLGIDKSSGNWFSANSGNNSLFPQANASRRCPNFPGYVAPICGIIRSSAIASMNNASVTDLRTDELDRNNTTDFAPSASGNNATIAGGTLFLSPAITAATSATIRRSYRLKLPSSGTWDVRVKRITADHDPVTDKIYDEIYWTSLRSINSARLSVTMEGLTLVEVRVRASEQFNGTLDDFTVLATTICKDYDEVSDTWIERVSSNPASLFRFLLQGPFNKRPLADAKIDLDTLAIWHEYCTGQGFAFNLYCDYQTALFEMLVNVAASGRSSPTYQDGKYSTITDKEQTTICQHFTPRTSWGFSSSKIFYTPPHAFRITMADETQDYATEEAFVYDDGYDANNATLFEEMKLIGCTNYHDAWKQGRFHLAQLRLRPETFKINADIENIVCTRGDLVRVTHDVPMWGLGTGRIKATGPIGVQNGDFEYWSDGADHVPDHWYWAGNNINSYIVQETTIKETGLYSAKLTPGPEMGGSGQARQRLDTFMGIEYWRGKTIYVSARVRGGPGVASAGMYLWLGEEETMAGIVLDSVWHTYTLSYVVPSTANSIILGFTVEEGDTLYIDNVRTYIDTLGEVSAITLDEIVPMAANNSYAARIRLQNGDSIYAPVATVAGNNNTLTFSTALIASNNASQVTNGSFEVWSNGTGNAPDSWILSGSNPGNVAQNATIRKTQAGNYSAKITTTLTVPTNTYLRQNFHEALGIAYWQGKNATFCCWAYANAANTTYLLLDDGVDTSISDAHPGDSIWRWLSVTRTIANNASRARAYTIVYGNGSAAAVGYFDGGVVVEGDTLDQAFPQKGDLVLFGEATDESVECLVKSIRPTEDLCAEIELMDYSEAVYTSDVGTIPAYDTHITATPTDLAPIIYSVRSDERVMIKRGNIWSCRILVNFKPRTSDRMRDIAYMEGNFKVAYSKAAWLGISNISRDAASVYIDNVEQGVTYWLRFRYIYKDSHAGPWCSTYSHEVVGKSGHPSDASFDDANCTFEANRIKFVILPISDFDLNFYEIRTDTDFGDADGLIIKTRSLVYIYTGLLAINATYYLKACDTSGIYSVNADSITAPSSDVLSVGTISTDFTTNDLNIWWGAVDPKKLAYYTVAIYNNSDMAVGHLIYTSNQFTNPHFTFMFDMNSDTSGGPYRELWVRVTAHDIYSRTAYADGYGINAVPPTITDLTAQAGIEMLILVCGPLFSDIIGYEFACDTDDPPTDSVEVGTNFASFTGLVPGTTYYYRARATDYFGYGNWCNTANATPESATVDEAVMDIPITNGANWNATPGNIVWDAHTLTYKGNSYNMAAGNAGTSIFVYWNAAAGNNYNNADTMPLTDDMWMMVYRNGNNAYPALQSRIIHGGLIQANTLHANRIQAGTLMVGNIVGSSGSLNFTSSGSLSFASASGNFTVSAGNFTVSLTGGMNVTSANGILIQSGAAVKIFGNATTPGVLTIYRNGITGNAMSFSGLGTLFQIVPSANNTETLQFGNSTMRWSQLQVWAQNNLYLGSGQFIDMYVGANAFISLGSNNIITLWCSSGLEVHGNLHNNSLTNISRIATGNYTGDNNNARTITVGWRPKYVNIHRTAAAAVSMYTYEADNQAFFDGGANMMSICHLATAYYAMNNYITSFSATGFVINYMGNAYSPNNGATVYEWTAFG